MAEFALQKSERPNWWCSSLWGSWGQINNLQTVTLKKSFTGAASGDLALAGFHSAEGEQLRADFCAAQCGNTVLNGQCRHSFHKMSDLKHISHYSVCLCAVRPRQYCIWRETEGKRLGSWRAAEKEREEEEKKEEEHFCALMLMMSEYMEKRASEGKEEGKKRNVGLEMLAGSECPSPSHHPPSATLVASSAALSAYRMWSFLSGNEVTSGETVPMWQVILAFHWGIGLFWSL